MFEFDFEIDDFVLEFGILIINDEEYNFQNRTEKKLPKKNLKNNDFDFKYYSMKRKKKKKTNKQFISNLTFKNEHFYF